MIKERERLREPCILGFGYDLRDKRSVAEQAPLQSAVTKQQHRLAEWRHVRRHVSERVPIGLEALPLRDAS
jgi:hypothetical protein